MAVDANGFPMFFAGLILLIPHRIGMSRVNYIIKRYNLPISRAGLLLYKFHNPIEVSLFIGNVLGVAISIPISTVAFSGTGQADNNKRRNWLNGLMIAFLSLMLLSSILLFIIYISGDDYGHLNSFYITLILITFFDGFTNAFAFGFNPGNSSLYAAGIPVSGFLVSGLHNIYKFFSDNNHWDDFDYYVLFLKLLWNILILSVSIIAHILIWNMPAKNNCGFKADTNNLGPADITPICMLAFSLGTVYAFYPSIAPYSIIDYQYASVIELWILVISSSPTLIFAILDCFGYGPSGVSSSGKMLKNWTTWDTGSPKYYGQLWQLIWICAIPYILCIQIFMTMLHYPDSLLSCFFKNHPYFIGFISVLFNTVREAMQACGFAGAGKQMNLSGVTEASNAKPINGAIASSNKPITLFVMMFCVFTGDGYLQHYRRCCRDCWPTTGYNKCQSFRYWLRYGFKGGSKSFRTAFTDGYHRNIRQQIISYA